MRYRIWELIKDLLIVVLALVIAVLTLLALPSRTVQQTPWLASLLTPFTNVLGMERMELTQTQQQERDPAAAQPVAISVMGAAGRSSAMYDAAALEERYASLGSLLAQALDTAQPGTETTLARLYAALSGEQSVVFCYAGSIPPQTVASWLGADAPQNAPQAWLYALSAQEGAVQLYLLGETVWVYSTQMDVQTVQQALSGELPDGSFFAFESSDPVYTRLDSCTLLPGRTPVVYEAEVQNPCDSRFVTALASALGFNPYGDAGYIDEAGNAFYSETACSLQVYTDGRLRLLSRDENRFPAADGADGAIDAARALLGTLLSGVSSAARLELTEYTQDETGTVCTFEYVLCGIPVAQSSGAGARVTVQDGHITQVEAMLSGYTLLETPVTLLPPTQAAAVMDAGARMRLCYAPGTQQLTAGWIG